MAGSRRLKRLATDVVARVSRALAENGLAENRSPLLVAVSGGADSAVLAWAVREGGGPVRAVHVHHGWPASDRMEASAEAVAAQLRMDLAVVRVDATGPGSPEAVARTVRYAALEDQARAGELIATGHTSTDQAETVLGNLAWGAGLDGLRGIHRRRGPLVRPLLEVSSEETRELAVLLRLPFVDDPANEDQAYRRVRIRRALGGWERSVAPGIGLKLAEMARLVETDLDFLDSLAAGVPIETLDGAVRAPAAVLRTLPPAVAARAARRALRAAGGGYAGARRDVDALMQVARRGGSARTSGGLPVTRVGATVRVGARRSSGPYEPVDWSVAGRVAWGSWTWEADEGSGRPHAYPLSPWRQVFDVSVFSEQTALIRRVRRDDRVAMRNGRKGAREAMAEAGIPGQERDSWPVLEVDGRVLWIPGVRRAFSDWVTSDTIGHVLVSATREGTWKPAGY